MPLTFEPLNLPTTALPPHPTTQPFAIPVPPKTDIWRRPERGDMEFNAPGIGTRIPVSTFQSLSATISGPWKTQFDQGGILIAFPSSPGESLHDSQWIKAGVEYFDGEPRLGVVGTDRFSDWSLAPMAEGSAGKARFLAERQGGTVWVYVLVGGKKVPLREVKWADLEGRGQGAELWVGVYGAKPMPEEGDVEKGIEVSVEDLRIETV